MMPYKPFRTNMMIMLVAVSMAHADVSTGLVTYFDFESDIADQSGSVTVHNGTYLTANPVSQTGAGFAGDAAFAGGNDDGGADSTTDRSSVLVGNALNVAGNAGAGGSGAFYVGSLDTDGAGGGVLGNSFSVSAWFFVAPDADTAAQRHFVFEPRSNYGAPASDNYNISFGSAVISGASGLYTSYVGQDSAPEQTTLANAAWHHVLHTFSSDGTTTTMDVYIDGKKTTSEQAPTASVSFSGINFGMHRAETGRVLDGMLDEIAVWHRALTSSDIASVYAMGLNDTPLVSADPPSSAPTINGFTASPSNTLVGGTVSLAWEVSGASSVTLSEGLGRVAATNSQNVTVNADTIYTLVAINGNAVETAQVSLTVDGPTDPVGPCVGTVKQTEAFLLYSPGPDELDLRLTVMTEAGATVTSTNSRSLAANDYVAKFHITGLSPGITYRYKVEKMGGGGGAVLYAGDDAGHTFTTIAINRTNQVIKAAFLSCMNDSAAGVWQELGNQGIDLLCLGGDAPYVDTGTLSSIRSKHRHLMQRPGLTALMRNTPTVGIWDDHDFGLNNGNGVTTASRKVNTRRGFVEYRAHDQYGDGAGGGVYHRVDLGAMEIFLLDPRWYSQTAASPVDASQSTCFGSAQWAWLLAAIRDSKAPFKVLVQGQIWQDKKNTETDDMYTYWSERDALLDIIRDEKIPGVVLVGGDIHVSRYLMHPMRVGYDLHDFVTSPAHSGTIASLNVYHPSLEWSRVAAHQFLTLKADTTQPVAELTAQYVDDTGAVHHELVIPYDQLTYREGRSLSRGLRGLWTFDEDFKNLSPLGSRLDATATNGATLMPAGGVRGGGISLARSSSQYLSVPRSLLDDNASTYTASAWCKAVTLPMHGTADRHFILESCVNDHTDGLPNASTSGYAVSLGIRASTDAQDVNMQLYTETLDPKGVGSLLAPGTLGQGGFDWNVDRTLILDKWVNVVATFDASTLRLYINGVLAVEHALPTPAPIAETGGLIIGGHRHGTGRNFDGLIDEVAIWNRVLSNAEITFLYNAGSPPDILSALPGGGTGTLITISDLRRSADGAIRSPLF